MTGTARDQSGRAPELAISDLEIGFADAAGAPFDVLTLPALAVAGGTRLAVTGPSGSGKSSFLYAIAGLLRPRTGKIAWAGTDIVAIGESGRDRWRRRHVGFVFQDFHLIGELTPLDNVLVGLWFDRWRAGSSDFARARDLLERVGVPPRRRSVGELSRGERQRVAIARALMRDPPVLLADEPTASLDAAAGDDVGDLLLDVAGERQRTFVCVTHDARLLGRFATVYDLSRGRLALRGGTAPASTSAPP